MTSLRLSFRAFRSHYILHYALLLLSKALAEAHDGCPYHVGYSSDISSVVVVKQTIHIKTNVLQDTTFVVNKELTLTVDNAPTNIDTITTFFSQSTISQNVDR